MLLLYIAGDTAIFLHSLNFLEALEALFYSLQIGQHAAQPAVGHIVLVVGLGHFADNRLRLLFGADQQHLAAAADSVTDKIARAVELLCGLREINDVDSVVCLENIRPHSRVPSSGLMSEMDTRLQ